MPPRTLTILTLLALTTVSLTGCFGGDDPPEDDEDDVRHVRGAVGPAPDRATNASFDHPNTSVATSTEVESFDGHMVPITIYQPTWADAQTPAAVLLHGHGWAGSRATAPDAFADYVAGGFGVVSIDMRGFGDARQESEARVMNIDYEIKDVIAVIDHVATLDWVLLDAPGDPRLGAIGGSYGGGYQLLTAVFDGRLDAIAPEITWSNLPRSLAPNGAPKSAWVDVLYGAGNALGRLAPEIHEGFLYVQATNQFPDGSDPGEPDLLTPFTASSPSSYPFQLRVPTLVIQGANDTLFNLNEAVDNFRLVESSGAPVQLVTHFGGHILNTQGTLNQAPSPTPAGLQPPSGPSPCGDIVEISIAWFQRHLMQADVNTGPRVCLAIDATTVATAQSLPWQLEPTSAQADLTIALGPAGQEAQTLLYTAEQDTYLAGVPFLAGNLTTTAPDAILYWRLDVHPADGSDPYTLNAQITPQRVAEAAAGTPFLQEMMGISAHLNAGDELRLTVSSSDPQYAHNQGRSPGPATIDGISVWLPFV